MCGYFDNDNILSKTTYKMQISWKEDIDNNEKNTLLSITTNDKK